MIPVLGARAMRAADAAAIRAGVGSDILMENAAAALCAAVHRRFSDWKRVTVVCGPGNNGGDGLAAARMLALSGVSVRVFTLSDPEGYRGDAAANAARARSVGLTLAPLSSPRGSRELARALSEGDGVIDALFGTGLSRGLGGAARRAVVAMNAAGRSIAAADVPSGLSADGGGVPGVAVRASLTVAFGAPKLCHVLAPASGFCGTLEVADIGIPREFFQGRAFRLRLVEALDVRALLPPRPRASNKGDFGRVAVIAGSRGKAGAAILAARGALRAGAGLVTVFCAGSLEDLVVAALPEAMTHALPEKDGAIAPEGERQLLRALMGFDAAVLGPGLGTSPGTVRVVEAVVLGAAPPLVVDADGLNAFAGRPAFFARRKAPLVLTPHPGEAGRLLGLSSRQVQLDRLAAAGALARRSRAVALLKGAHTLTAVSSGQIAVNPTGTPLLSTAGAGDVLAGMIAALMAGGLGARDAAMAGAWLHGAAADTLEDRLGDAGLLAHEIADAVPGARRSLVFRSPTDE